MRKHLFIPIIALALTFTACGDDDINPQTGQNQIQETVASGLWKITYFNDSGDDETYHFVNYDFTFENDGTLTATNNTTTYTGEWSITDSNSGSDDDNPHSDLDFNIFFNLSNEFEELNDDWDILSQSDDKIELIDVSGGNGGTDYLTFERM